MKARRAGRGALFGGSVTCWRRWTLASYSGRMTAPGTRLSLDAETWLQPLDDDQALDPDAEYLIALVESYVVFPDGEVARSGIEKDDELELYEGLVRITPDELAARPARVGAQREAWARQLVRDVIDPQVRQLRGSSARICADQGTLSGNGA